MLLFLFCLVAALTSVLTKNVYVTENGFSTGPVEGRIAGGEEVHDNKMFDYQVQIVHDMKFCSGAILNHHYILTAAHCVQGVQHTNDVMVRAGSEILGGGMRIPISEIHLHPQFDDASANNFDIAYMKTHTRMNLARSMGHVILPDDSEVPKSIIIAGWGVDGYHGDKLSERIKYVKLNVINPFACQIFYPMTPITRYMFCAQISGDFSKGACKGDGGGPATEPETRKLVGISSFSKGCGEGMSPSVFTRVGTREILEFIRNGTGIHERPHEVNTREVDDDHHDPETKIGNENIGTNDDTNNDESGFSNNTGNDDSGTNDEIGIDENSDWY